MGRLTAFAIVWAALTAPAMAQENEALRERALSLVNSDRSAHGLPALELSEDLVGAAQAHADDMARRGFYAHESPEGDTVRDRFSEAGGDRWKVVAENIARCIGCPVPPGEERVEAFEEGWMNSPGHRENILGGGLAGFGYGVAFSQDRTYAVQTFAGPGLPRGVEAGEEPQAIGREEQVEMTLARVNEARETAGVEPLEARDALSRLAQRLITDESASDGDVIDRSIDLFAALPQEAQGQWRSVRVLAAACGGCGMRPTAADIRHFAGQWLGDAANRQILTETPADGLGFALSANGEGRKTAVVVIGQSR